MVRSLIDTSKVNTVFNIVSAYPPVAERRGRVQSRSFVMRNFAIRCRTVGDTCSAQRTSAFPPILRDKPQRDQFGSDHPSIAMRDTKATVLEPVQQNEEVKL